MAGITPQGFEPKPLEDIKTDLESGFRAVFGAAITVIAQSIFGQIIGITADRLADLWQLGLALYNGSTREGASGIQLDNIGALTGSTRKQATYTKVDLLCGGTPATIIPAGSLAKIDATNVQFTNDSDVTIGGGGTVTATFRALLTGPKAAPAGTVTTIDTPVAGWASVTNPLDQSELGTDVEPDAEFRMRQVEELRAQGASTVAALRAKLSELSGVSGVFVFENDHDTTDSDGLPPHSFECVVSGGLDADIAQTIATYKPVGIATYGTSAVGATDANGFAVTINFSRPTQLNAYIVINQKASVSGYPSTGDAQVKAAIAALQPNYGIGIDFRASALIPAYLGPEGIPGVLETDMPLIGTAPSPGTSTTIPVNNRQQISIDTSRITVNTTLVNPS